MSKQTAVGHFIIASRISSKNWAFRIAPRQSWSICKSSAMAHAPQNWLYTRDVPLGTLVQPSDPLVFDSRIPRLVDPNNLILPSPPGSVRSGAVCRVNFSPRTKSIGLTLIGFGGGAGSFLGTTARSPTPAITSP